MQSANQEVFELQYCVLLVANDKDLQWFQTAFPSYLQSEADEFCDSWEEKLQVGSFRVAVPTMDKFTLNVFPGHAHHYG